MDFGYVDLLQFNTSTDVSGGQEGICVISETTFAVGY